MKHSCCSHSNTMKKIVLGLTLIAAGIIFMLDKMNLITPEVKDWLFTWPMLLMAIGVVNLFSKDSFVAGLILIMVGGFFLIPKIIFFPFNFFSMFWPLLLIGAGVLVILKHSFRRAPRERYDYFRHSRMGEDGATNTTTATPNVDGYVEDFNLFGGSKRKMNSKFRGGKFVNIFGGAEVDLSQAIIDGDTAMIETICVFGGVTLFVPSDWEVHVEVVSILGGFSDKRSYVRTSVGEDKKVLVVKGVCVFGGGEIKSV